MAKVTTMAVMSDADRHKAARIVARKWAADGNVGEYSHTDYFNAVSALDNALEDTVANLAGSAGQTIAVRLNAELPAPFSGATTLHKSLLFGVTVGVKYGWITSGGD